MKRCPCCGKIPWYEGWKISGLDSVVPFILVLLIFVGAAMFFIGKFTQQNFLTIAGAIVSIVASLAGLPAAIIVNRILKKRDMLDTFALRYWSKKHWHVRLNECLRRSFVSEFRVSFIIGFLFMFLSIFVLYTSSFFR